MRDVNLNESDATAYACLIIGSPNAHIIVAVSDDEIVGACGMSLGPALGFTGPLMAEEVFWIVASGYGSTKATTNQ